MIITLRTSIVSMNTIRNDVIVVVINTIMTKKMATFNKFNDHFMGVFVSDSKPLKPIRIYKSKVSVLIVTGQ